MNNRLVHAYTVSPILTAWKKQAKTKSEDIIGNGLLGNLLYPWSSNRAGTAAGMAKAMGAEKGDIPFSVNHPRTTSALSSLLGGGLGAAGGLALGNALDVGHPSMLGIAGGGAGSILGYLLNALVRKTHQEDIREEYDEADLEDLDPKKPGKSNALMNVLNVYGGPHRYSQKQIHDLIEAEKLNPEDLEDFVDQLSGNRNIGNAAMGGADLTAQIAGRITQDPIIGSLGLLAKVPHGIRSNMRANEDKSMYAEYQENKERIKNQEESRKYNKNKA